MKVTSSSGLSRCSLLNDHHPGDPPCVCPWGPKVQGNKMSKFHLESKSNSSVLNETKLSITTALSPCKKTKIISVKC